MFQIHSTDTILTEVKYHLLKNHPDQGGQLVHRVYAQVREVLDEIYEDFPDDPQFSGLDARDRHVHSAAIYARSDVVLSNNASSDIATAVQPYEVFDVDSFFCFVADSAPRAFRAAVRGQFEFWCGRKNEHRAALDDRLMAAGCLDFAQRVTRELQAIALE